MYLSLIDAILLGGKAHSVLGFRRSSLDGDVCNHLLAALMSDGYDDYTHKMFVKMSQRGLNLSTLGFWVYVESFCRSSDTNQLLRHG